MAEARVLIECVLTVGLKAHSPGPKSGASTVGEDAAPAALKRGFY